MLIPLRTALGALFLTALASSSANALHRSLTGSWRGVLEYRDYQKPDERVTLPTTLDVAALGDSAVDMHFVYDDGPGKTVVDDDRFAYDARTQRVRWGASAKQKQKQMQEYVVRTITTDMPAGTMSMLLEGEGSDNDLPATIRETIVVTGDSLRILKETRPSGGVFAFRHEYRFARVR